ncbi:hypothetical protein [Amycolatopsis suaedae]|uniref:Uncharacterized protein n=1 Tax=Amycolatopsis suaedae TaxID=2510978 RepID=A0A4Q7J0K5_9PSEU|nr:hypothetical protein [Amycolatopsis suaedae]RZQ60871.1 hypothetical protein EWH70_27625 [Amycolatopsis suaedae]
MNDQPCWVLVDTGSGETVETDSGIPHFLTEQDATRRARELAAEGQGGLVARRERFVCVLGPDCAGCDGAFAEWTDGADHIAPVNVDATLAAVEWVRDGGGWRCPDCAAAAGLVAS